MAAPVALLLVKNPIVARKTAQVLECGGMEVVVTHELPQLVDALERGVSPVLVCVPDTAVDGAIEALRTRPHAKLFVYTEELRPELFQKAMEAKSMGGVFGVRYPGAGPRAWELLTVACRLSRPGNVPPPNAPLSWGHDWYEIVLSGSADRPAAVSKACEFANRFVTGRLGDAIAQVADELVMNAVYDAPTDASGRPKYAHRRKQAVELEPEERPTIGFGCDGMRLVLSASDPFGALPRDAVFNGLHRGFALGAMDTSGGGAGLGMMLICQTAKIVYFDIVPRRLTQVTTVVELDVPLRHLRKLPSSVHTFVHST